MNEGSQDSLGGGDAAGARSAAVDPRAALIAALEWQLEAGVDETIGEAPIDRTQLPARAPTSRNQPGGRGEAPPSRACVAVAQLPKGARVEIDAIALCG